MPRSGIAGVWGICSPQCPHQVTHLLGQGFLGPRVFASTCPSDGCKVELIATSHSFSLLTFSPGCAAEGSEEASHVPCTLLPFKTRGSNCWVSPPYHLLSSMHKALTRSQPAGQGMVREPKDVPRCMANQDGPRNSVHTDCAKSTHWLQLACLPPRSRK